MGFWNSYPFTDYYRAQLDWIIARMKEIAPTVARLQEIEAGVNAALARCEQIATDVDIAEQNCQRIEQICTGMLDDIEAAKNSAIEDITTATNTAIDRALAEINAALATIDEHVQDARTWSDIARQKADSATRSAEICYGYASTCMQDAAAADNSAQAAAASAQAAETVAELYTSPAEKWIRTHQNNIITITNDNTSGAISRPILYTIQRCKNTAPETLQRFSFPCQSVGMTTIFNAIYIELDVDNSMEIDLVQDNTTIAAIRLADIYDCVNILYDNNQYTISDGTGTVYASVATPYAYIPVYFQNDTTNDKIFADYLMVKFYTGGKPISYRALLPQSIGVDSRTYCYKLASDYNLSIIYPIDNATVRPVIESIVAGGGIMYLNSINQYIPQNYEYVYRCSLADFINKYW